jgi:CubicO group peptidase (beta-lactamase class C family)
LGLGLDCLDLSKIHKKIQSMKSLFIYILLITNSIFVNAQSDSIDDFIQTQIEKKKIVGLSVGIFKDGKIIKTKGYGFANLENDIAASEKTVYKIGSVSKQIIATAVMKFVQSGQLSLQDPVNKFFKDAPAHWSKITVRHLLNHTSGLQRESPAFEQMVQKPDSVLIKAAYKDSLVFQTGAKWQYCNLGYFMLADIIRQISGKTFKDYMENEVFKKYGLLNTSTTSYKPIIKNRADGYVTNHDLISNAVDYVALRPSGAFLSTIDDMMKWEMLLQENKMLSNEYSQQMINDKVKTTTILNGEGVYYGYGWMTTNFQGKKVAYHAGALPGFRAMFYRFPDEKTAVVILTNSEPDNLIAIAEGISKIVFSSKN